MMLCRSIPQLRDRLRSFARHKRGVAAVEAALIFPFMVIALLGGTELSEAIAVRRKVALVTRAVTDLTTQYITMSNSDVSTVLNASAAIIAPYAAANMTVTMSEVTVDNGGNATVTWSRSLNGTPLAQGQKITLPGNINQPNTSLILGQVSYSYVPRFSNTVLGTKVFADQIFMNPRLVNSITLTGS